MNKANRPKSSIVGKKQITKITRIFTSISTSRIFIEYKSNTLMSLKGKEIYKTKYSSQELYNLKKIIKEYEYKVPEHLNEFLLRIKT